MKPAPFAYHRARDAEGATRLLAELGDEAKVIAGGQSLVAMMNFRLARPRHLVDIGGLKEFDYVTDDADGALRISSEYPPRCRRHASSDDAAGRNGTDAPARRAPSTPAERYIMTPSS